MDYLIYDSSENHEITKTRNDKDRLSQFVKEHNGMYSLLYFLVKKYRYTLKARKSDNLFSCISAIYEISAEKMILPQFNIMYDDFKMGVLEKSDFSARMIEIIKEDEKIMSVLEKYEPILNEILDNLISVSDIYQILDTMPTD